MRNSIEPKIMQRVVEIPTFVQRIADNKGFTNKYFKIAETLKILDSTKCMSWDEEEFIQQFGLARDGKPQTIRHALIAMRAGLTKAGIERPRVIFDPDTHVVYVFRNDK